MTKQQKLVVAIAILASFVAFLDGSVVNVALPAISSHLGGGLATQQWVVDAYLITLGSLILIAGSLSDLFGRKRVLSAGIIGFAVTSLMCALAPDAGFLIASRTFQGVAGALLVPSSLALIMSNISGDEQGKAIGSWTGWTGMAFLVGPLLGGFLVDSLSWRYIFAINIIPTAVTLWLMKLLAPEKTTNKNPKIDFSGAVLGALGLAGPVYALIEKPNYGWSSPRIYLPLVAGVILLGIFIGVEKRIKQPMLPLSLFKNRNFTVGNIATLSIYAGLSVATFLIIIFLQQAGGYSAIQSGLSIMPVTIIMFFLSSRFGGLASKHGPRLFMSVGPIMAAAGFLLMMRVTESINYWTELFPGVVLFGLGLSVTVTPLTSAILGAVDKSKSGIASAFNNAVARIAGLIAIASVGVIVGPELNFHGFKRGIIAMSVLLILGGLVSVIGIQNKKSI